MSPPELGPISVSQGAEKTMRKVIWSCSAVAAALSVGLVWAGFYAVQHPESNTAKCLIAASSVAMMADPVNAVPRLLHGGDCEESSDETLQASGVMPMEPVAVEEEPEVKPTVAIIGLEPLPQLPTLAEVAKDTPPADCQPMTMPYAGDDESQENDSPWDQFFNSLKLNGEEGGFLIEFLKDAANTTSEEFREDNHRGEQYPGCPYTGCPSGSACPSHPIQKQETPGSNEASEDEKKMPTKAKRMRLFKLNWIETEYNPKHFDVDTMEFRPSDETLPELRPSGL
jgi:hypothetical protein